jgi:hypothetical protein
LVRYTALKRTHQVQADAFSRLFPVYPKIHGRPPRLSRIYGKPTFCIKAW